MKSPVSLYDALVSAQVPGDKARAVAEALESDMSVHLATRQDQLLLRKDVESLGKDLALLRTDMGTGFASVRMEMDAGFAAVRKEMDTGFAAVRKEMDAGFAGVRKDMDHFGDRLMLRFAGFMIVCLSLLFAALRYLP